jgi:hypothetical protein
MKLDVENKTRVLRNKFYFILFIKGRIIFLF